MLIKREHARAYMDELNELNKKYNVSVTHVDSTFLTIQYRHYPYSDIIDGSEDGGWTFSRPWGG